MDLSRTSSTRRTVGLLEAMWRYRWLVVGATVVAGLLGGWVAGLQATRYSATASVLLADPQNQRVFNRSEGGQNPARVANELLRAESEAVMARTSRLLGDGTSPSEVDDLLSFRPSDDADRFNVTASAPTASRAARVANVHVEAYEQIATETEVARADRAVEGLETYRTRLQAEVDGHNATLTDLRTTVEAEVAADVSDPEFRPREIERRLEASAGYAEARTKRDSATEELIELQDRQEQERIDAGIFGSGVESVDAATAPAAPSEPRPQRGAMAAALVGLLGSSALAWWKADQAPRASSGQEVNSVLDAPEIAQVSLSPGLRRHGTRSIFTDPGSNPYRSVAGSVMQLMDRRSARSVAITGIRSGVGATTLALALGERLVTSRRRTVVVDADLRHRTLSRVTGLEHKPGLAELAEHGPIPATCSRVRIGRAQGMATVGAGSPVDPEGLVGSSMLRSAVDTLQLESGTSVFDTSGLLDSPDAAELCGWVQGVILVVGPATPLRDLEEARLRLERVDAVLLGFVRTPIEASRRSDRSEAGDPPGLEHPALGPGPLPLTETARTNGSHAWPMGASPGSHPITNGSTNGNGRGRANGHGPNHEVGRDEDGRNEDGATAGSAEPPAGAGPGPDETIRT